jgi:hypothetical protein
LRVIAQLEKLHILQPSLTIGALRKLSPAMDTIDDVARAAKKPRVAFETEHLATLKASYLAHFLEWSKGKTKVEKLVISFQAKLVYKDFIDEKKSYVLQAT